MRSRTYNIALFSWILSVNETKEFFAEPHIVRDIVYIVPIVLSTGPLSSEFSSKYLDW